MKPLPIAGAVLYTSEHFFSFLTSAQYMYRYCWLGDIKSIKLVPLISKGIPPE